jgi:hypothetical protein
MRLNRLENPFARQPVEVPRQFTHERAGRLLAGLSVVFLTALGYFHHPLWMLGLVGTAMNLILSSMTDRCVVKNLLIRLGLPGERDLGRAEAQNLPWSSRNASRSLRTVGEAAGTVEARSLRLANEKPCGRRIH